MHAYSRVRLIVLTQRDRSWHTMRSPASAYGCWQLPDVIKPLPIINKPRCMARVPHRPWARIKEIDW